MRKIILLSIFVCFGVAASAQLNVKTTSSESERFYKDDWSTVTWNGSAFMFNSSDQETALTVSFTLGRDTSSALTTLRQLDEWFRTAEKKTSITFEDNGRDLTLYKYDKNYAVFTTGDAEFARNEYNRRISGALVGVKQYTKKEATPHFSYIQKKAIEKSMDAISALTDPKYIGRDAASETAQ